MLIVKLSAVIALLIHAATAKVFTKCELAKELSEIASVRHEDIGTFVCIAERQSGLNTEVVGQGLYYGMYQMSSEFWCDSYGRGKECNLNCNDLLNDDISDDVRCLQMIIAEHQRWSGNGFSAWPSGASCQAQGNSYISECSIQSNQISASYTKNNYQNSFNSGKVSSTQKKKTGKGKVYERCELAKELGEVYGIAAHEIGTYVCLAERQSGLNTQAIGDGIYYGMYQMSSEFWCDTYGRGKACNINCNDLLDDDLSDDLQCMQTILAEHQRLSGNGFSAWPSGTSCQAQGSSYISDCSINSNHISTYNNNNVRKAPSTQRKPSGSAGKGKVYERCELARELRYKHDISMDHIATWVCIAKHESNFNTSAIGRLNWDGSEDHGLFQISDLYWCGPNGKACGLTCDELEDSDITNDIECIKMIHKEHTRLSGDGFSAWTVYPRCKGQSDSHIDGCFDDSDNEIIPFKPQPGVVQPHTPNYLAHPKTKLSSVGTGKVYDRCELARELRDEHNIPLNQIATWVCIAKHESNFNTSAIGRLNWDGSEDHGLFQISDIYWCGANGKACNAQCDEFRDNNLSNDIKCIRKIHEEHTRLSGDGFNAWTVYKPKCKGRAESFIKGCFDDSSNEILPFKPQPGVQQPNKVQSTKTSDHRKHYEKVPGKGKVYERCELAQELRYKFKIPMEQVSTWVCIAKHESNFNTSAIGRLNWDGSEDHGLFQISDIYWCSPPGQGKGCGLSCAELEDNDIADDVECMLKIHEEHTFLSGDGFNAWAVYRPHCQGRSESYISGCFTDDDNYIPSFKPAVTQLPTVKTTQKLFTTSTSRPTVSTTRLTVSTTRLTVSTTKSSTTRPTVSTTKSLTNRPTVYTTKSSTTRPTVSTTKSSTTRPTVSTTKSSTVRPTVSTTKFSTTRPTVSTTKSSTTRPTVSATKSSTTRPTVSTTKSSTTRPTVSTTKSSTSKTYQFTRYSEPVTTTEKFFYTTLLDTTTISDLLTTNKIYTQPKSWQNAEKKSIAPKSVNSSPTVKPFNIFDLYFNSFKNSNSNTAPQQKNIIINPSTSKPQTTKNYSSATTKQPNKSFNDQKSSTVTIKSYRVPSSTAKNVYSTNSPTINHKESTKTSPTTKSTFVTPTRNSITQNKQQTITTTSKPNILQASKTSTIVKAPASFNIFSYYLTGFTSKAPPIEYKPIQFSDKSTIIFKKPSPGIVQPSSNTFQTSTEKSFFKNDAEIYGTTKASLFFNHFPTHYLNSGIEHNRIGRLVTPHSIEYLLKLTTPKTPRTYYG